MTHVKEYLRMAHNAGFAVLVIVEDGVIGDAILLAQALLQQLVGQHAQTLPLFKFELQGLLTTLLRNLTQRRLQIKIPYLLAYIYSHFLFFSNVFHTKHPIRQVLYIEHFHIQTLRNLSLKYLRL